MNTEALSPRYDTLRSSLLRVAAPFVAVLALASCSGKADQQVVAEAYGTMTPNTIPVAPTTPDTTPMITGTTVEIPKVMPTVPIDEVPGINPEQVEDPHIITFTNMGGLKPGINSAEVDKKYTVESICGGRLGQISTGDSKFTLVVRDGLLASIETESPSVVTSTGIHVGSTKSEVLAAYGPNTQSEQVMGSVKPYEALVVNSPDPQEPMTKLIFNMKDNSTVRSIDLNMAERPAMPHLC